jgi:transcriptional regulator with XRE-family HTH domain
MGYTSMQECGVTRSVTMVWRVFVRLSPVGQPVHEKTFLRKWRKKKRLSLRQLAARMEYEPGVQLISHAQLQRIETGEQAYTQPILEAAALALGITTSMILDVDPDKEGDVIDLLRYLKGPKRDQAIEFLRFLANK